MESLARQAILSIALIKQFNSGKMRRTFMITNQVSYDLRSYERNLSNCA